MKNKVLLCYICNKGITSPDCNKDNGLVVTNNIFGIIHPYHRLCASKREFSLSRIYKNLSRLNFKKLKVEYKTKIDYRIDKSNLGIINSKLFTFISIILIPIFLLLTYVLFSQNTFLNTSFLVFYTILIAIPLITPIFLRIYSYLNFERLLRNTYKY